VILDNGVSVAGLVCVGIAVRRRTTWKTAKSPGHVGL
jgi:hypothetical protein